MGSKHIYWMTAFIQVAFKFSKIFNSCFNQDLPLVFMFLSIQRKCYPACKDILKHHGNSGT